MGCLPYLKFYPADWLSDQTVRMMSPEARGVYWDLLSVAWNEGAIPSDPSSLARWLGLTPKRWERVWAEIAPLWQSDGNGGLVNKRLEAERADAIEKHRLRVEAGKKGGRPKKA